MNKDLRNKEKMIVYGNFKLNDEGSGGQITKTRNVYKFLCEKYPHLEPKMFNMENWKKRPISTFLRFKKTLKACKTLIILPGDNNFKFLIRFLPKYIKKYNINVYYMVVGGWLYDFVKNKDKFVKALALFKGVFVETILLKNNLETLGLNNIFYSPVFSMRRPIDLEEAKKKSEIAFVSRPLKFCTFSRVLEEKGILDAVLAIKKLREVNNLDCELHIFGKIDDGFKNLFYKVVEDNRFVRYEGFIPNDSVIETLSNYCCLLFPTYYYGEGFPATLLEAYMASLPIIASNWKYNSEIIIDNKTGFLFTVRDIDGIIAAILKLIKDKDNYYRFRMHALQRSELFTPDKALSPLIVELEKNEDYI